MGRNPTPTAILETRGSFIQNPSRKRPDEPTTTQPLGPAREHLSHDEQDIWNEVSQQLLPGVGKISDRIAFEALVILIAKMRAGTLKAVELMSVVSLCARFGMTPADRSKIVVEQPKKSSLDSFLNRNKPEPLV